MPDKTKFGPLSSLLGRTFERDGKRYEVGAKYDLCFFPHVSMWQDGGVEAWPVEKAQRWLSGAKEVTP